MTVDIKLPPLPKLPMNDPAAAHKILNDYGKACAKSAIKADRQHTATLLTNPAHVHTNMCRGIIAPVAFDQLAHILGDDATQEWLDNRQHRGEPVAYGIKPANTGKIVTLVLAGEDAEFEGVTQMRPEHVVPLYTAPQPATPAQEPFAYATHHDEPMMFTTYAEAESYCDDDEAPIPLYDISRPGSAAQEPSDNEMAVIWDQIHASFGREPFRVSHVDYSRALLARYGSKS